MQATTELSPRQFRLAYPDTCFACHGTVKGYRYAGEEIVACSAGCEAKLAREGSSMRLAPPVPWATDDEEALPN